MRILITGSSGQIGTNLALRLQREGHTVFGVDKRLNTWTDDFRYLLQDLSGHYPTFPGGIGGVEYQRRIELGFAARISPERRDEAAALQRERERQTLFDNLYRDLRAHETPRAIAAATQWLRGVAPHELTGDVRALLDTGNSWNEPREYSRLLHGLLPVLLQLRQPALAFTVAEAEHGASGRFVPADETTAVALIDYALQTGRRRAAARLMDGYLKVHQGGTGARLAALRDALRPAADPP